MVFPPSREAYEALINEVKALKEELKRVRNEKKDISRTNAEVEFKDRKTRDRSLWMDIYNETTSLRKSTRLFGQELETDEWLEWRVKLCQRLGVMFSLLTMICWFATQHIATIVFGALGLMFVVILYYKNFSFVVARRLLKETNVVVILVLGLCNCSIEIGRSFNRTLDPIFGLVYMVAVFAFVFLDAVKVKSRMFVMCAGIIFIFVTVRNIYMNTLTDINQGIVLFDYSIQGNKYNFMKRSTQRAIFLEIMLFSMNGIYTIFKDRKQELMIFATGNIYRETGTASKEVEQKSFVRNIKLENDA